MRYSEEIIEEVRERNGIVDVIGSYVKLKRSGSGYMGLCPFHGEKSPSFHVQADRGMYHCFGCGVGGDVFTFIMEYENMSFTEAVKFLADRAGIKLPEPEMSQEDLQKKKLMNALYDVNRDTATYYYVALRREGGAEGMQYFRRRELTDETMKSFGLGFADNDTSGLYAYLKKKGYSDDILRESGIFRYDKGSPRGWFWNRVMFPIMDTRNRVIGFGGRTMGDGKPKYLNSPETKLFDKSRNLYGLNVAKRTQKKYFIVCEGYMDVISLHQAGFTNAVASLGTALTDGHCAIIARYTKNVYLTYDSDGAGIRAALRAIPMMRRVGISTRIIRMNPYKDPDEFIKAMGKDAFQERIDQAQNSFFFELEILEKDYNLTDPDGKTRFTTEAARRLARFDNEIERSNYIAAVADHYFIQEESLRKLVNTLGAREERPQEPKQTFPNEPVVKIVDYVEKKKKPDDSFRKAERMMITWLTDDCSLFEKIRGILGPDDFMEPVTRTVAAYIFDEYEREHQVVPNRVLNRFESVEEKREASSLFEEHVVSSNKRDLEKAFNETVVKLCRRSLDVQSNKAMVTGDMGAFSEIMRKRNALANLKIKLV